MLRDSTAADLARSAFPRAEIFLLANEAELATAVLTRRVLAVATGTPFPELQSLGHPDKLLVPFAQPLVTTGEAFAVRRDARALKDFLDSWITFRSLDGWLEQRRAPWFGGLARQDALPPEDRIVTPGQ